MQEFHMKIEFIEKIIQADYFSPIIRKVIRYGVYFAWGIGILFILWSGWRNLDQILPLIHQASFTHIFVAILYYLFGLVSAILLWLTIIRTFSRGKELLQDLKIYCVTFAARRLPGTIWYVGGRMILYQKIGVSKTIILLASLIEFIVGYVAAGIIGLGTFIFIQQNFPSILWTISIVVVVSGSIVVIPSLFRKLLKESKWLPYFLANTKDWLIWIISAISMWVFGGIMVIQLVKIFKPEISQDDQLFVIGAWAFSGLAGLLTYFLPSSLGATEFTLTIFLTQLLPLSLAGAVALATRLFTLAMDVFLAILFYPFTIRLSRLIPTHSQSDKLENSASEIKASDPEIAEDVIPFNRS